jgi:hypothetical protein
VVIARVTSNRRDTTHGDDRRFLMIVVAAGFAIRLLWLWQTHGGIDALLGAGEATRVALSVAQQGQFADAFFAGQGPTAHLLPISPGIAGSILWFFGPGSTPANLTLLAWSLLQTTCGILLLRGLFRALDADERTLRWGTALMCLVPPFVQQEVIDFRYWEGAMAAALATANLLLLVQYDARAAFGWREIAKIASLSALTFFVSPPAGLAVDACWAIFAFRRLPTRHIVQMGLSAFAALAIFVVPWTMRNQHALGETVPLRSNFGLEFALANHEAAVSGKMPEQVFAARLAAIHPYDSVMHRSVIAQRGGEVRYARKLGQDATAWAAAHPAQFACLYVRHIREFFFPRAWQMYFTGWEGMRGARAWTISLINLLGLAGLFFGLWSGRRGYWVLALYLAALALPFGLFQPMARYIYLAYGLLAFLGVEAVIASSYFYYARLARHAA